MKQINDEDGGANEDKDAKNDRDANEIEDEKTLLSNTISNTNIPATSPANHVLITPSPSIHTPARIGSINDLSKLIADVARSQTQQKIIIGKISPQKICRHLRNFQLSLKKSRLQVIIKSWD